MAIAQQNEIIDQIRGSIGDRTFRWRRGVQIVQRKSSPGTHTTPAAMRSKNNFAYTAFGLSKQIESTKNRFRFLARGQHRNFFNYFAGRFFGLAGTELQEITLPTSTDLRLAGVQTAKNPDGNIEVTWTTRSTDPNDWVEFIDAGYHSDGEFSGDAHYAVQINAGKEEIFADTWLAIFFRTKNGVLTSPTIGHPWLAKHGLDYSVKPRL